MALSAATQAALRSQIEGAAQVRWYLALAPYGDPIFTARVNDAAIAQGEREIVYDGDAGEGNVLGGYTLWVGSAANSYDVGKVRIKSINIGTNTITVAENDDIEWADDLYLTCPGEDGFRELWGVLPRITEAGGVVTFYEDYNFLYNDPADDVIPPKANAGPPVCAFLGTGGYVDISFTGDESFTTETGAAIAVYGWDFADGVLQSGGYDQAGTCANPNVVRFSTPGFRYCALVVTDNTGQARQGTVYIPVWIFNRTTAPPLSVEVLGQEGRPSWNLRVRAFETNSTATDEFYDYPDGALCVLFTETTYPNNSEDVGGFCFRSNIRFVGWLDGESLTFNYDAGTVDFTAISHDAVMRRLPGFPYTMEDDATPSDWYEINDLNMDRALHAHLERRSTVNQICHVETMGEGNARDIAIQGFEDGSVYTQAQQHLLADGMCTILSDRQGILRVRRDPQMMSAIDRAAVEVLLTVTSADWMNDIDEMKPKSSQLGMVRIGGFSYETPLLSQAPGTAPTQQESTLYKEGYIVEDQAELNLWSGCMYTKGNLEYSQVPVEMIGYWPVFDPADQEYIRMTVTDPLSRNAWVNKDFIVRSVSFRDMMLAGTTRTELILEEANDVFSGETQTIPVAPIPAPIEYNPPPGPVPPPNFCGALEKVIIRTNQGIFCTENFNEPLGTDVIWAASNNGLTPNQRQNMVDLAFDYQDGSRVFGIVDDYSVIPMAQADKGAFRNADIFGIAAWEQRFDGDHPQSEICIGLCGGNCGVASRACPLIGGWGTGLGSAVGTWRAVGCDVNNGDLLFIAGVYEAGVDSCRKYQICLHSEDALATLTCGPDFKHGSHIAIGWPNNHANGNITSFQGIGLFTYACGWGGPTDRHRAITYNNGILLDCAMGGELWTAHSHIWQSRADELVFFYTDQPPGRDIGISNDHGQTFTVWTPDILPDTPAASGQALTVHFMDHNHLMMIDLNNIIYYCTDGGFTWGICAAQTPDTPWTIVACADAAWPIPDGYGYITGANQPIADTDWVFLTRDLGQSWENRTGNLGDFLDPTTDTIWQIIPIQEEC